MLSAATSTNTDASLPDWLNSQTDQVGYEYGWPTMKHKQEASQARNFDLRKSLSDS